MDKIMNMRVMKVTEKDHKIWASPDPRSINKMIEYFFTYGEIHSMNPGNVQ